MIGTVPVVRSVESALLLADLDSALLSIEGLAHVLTESEQVILAAAVVALDFDDLDILAKLSKELLCFLLVRLRS